MELTALISRYPRLYHMAESGAWPNIKERGLLSTSAALDLYQIQGDERVRLESSHRPEKVSLLSDSLGKFVLRDQKPMNDTRISTALRGTSTPRAWYELLNGLVFFWTSRDRLDRLLCARAYRDDEHDVLTIDAEPLIRAYQNSILLCHMNSGNTFPIPHFRSMDTFKSVENYPVKGNGRPEKEVVELTVRYAVPDIAKYVIAAQRIRGETVVKKLRV